MNLAIAEKDNASALFLRHIGDCIVQRQKETCFRIDTIICRCFDDFQINLTVLFNLFCQMG